MSRSYITITGDTFDIIARKQYGNEQESNRILKANPGVSEPLSEGISIVIPDTNNNVLQNFGIENENEVSLLIDNNRYRFWSDIRISTAIDNITTVEFSAPLNIDDLKFREIFKPCSFKSVVVYIGSELIFTGIMVGVNPVLESTIKVISINCYSIPGVLHDCTPSASSYPLDFTGFNLKNIAEFLVKPFDIDIQFNAGVGAVFDPSVSLNGTNKILNFLSGLAKQRNLVISDTPSGNLLFQNSISTGKPVAKLSQGESPLLSVTPLFIPQNYYSHITGIEPVVIAGSGGSQFTVKNSRLVGVLRPDTFNVNDANGGDIETTVKARMGRMFGNMVSYTINVSTWRDSENNLWKPNTSIILHSHDAMIYKNYEFLIRNVVLKRDKLSTLAVLNLVLPGAFDGKIPEILPWD